LHGLGSARGRHPERPYTQCALPLRRRLTASSSNSLPSTRFPACCGRRDGAMGARPLVLMGHGGGQHKKAPDILARAHRFVSECGFAVAAVDVPSHGDRPQDEEYGRIVTENQARAAAGAQLAPLIASFQALVAARPCRNGALSWMPSRNSATSAPARWATGACRWGAGSVFRSSPPSPGSVPRCWAWAGLRRTLRPPRGSPCPCLCAVG
jgi:hypothetical protein